MWKLLIAIALFFLGSPAMAEICIGNSYEPQVIFNKQNPSVTIESLSAFPANGIINLQAKPTMDSSASPYFQWCVNIGQLKKNDNEFKSIKWILPSNWAEKVYRAKVYLTAGDMLGYEAYAKKSFLPPSGSVNLDPATPSTQLSVIYINNTDKFKISWQSKNTDNLEVLYSWDNVTYQRFALLPVKNQFNGSYTGNVSGSKAHQRIYFKPILYKGLVQIKGKAGVWEYAPQTVDNGNKNTETPVQAVLKSLKGRSLHNYVDIVWYEVKDSHGKNNAIKYEISYTNNYDFLNDKKITVTSGHSYRFENLEDDAKYYFRVRAINNKGIGDWSDIESIRIDLENNPVLDNSIQTPKNGTTGISKTPYFSWNVTDNDGDKLEYYVSIGKSSSNLNHKSGWLKGSQQLNYSDVFDKPLNPDTTYYWQVSYRESGHYKDYYGGAYPKSEVWHFKTVSTGPDLAITNIKRISVLKADEWVSFEVTIKNNGSEVADDESIKPYFCKNGTDHEFASFKWGNMGKQLKPGEEEKVVVKVQFGSDISERKIRQLDDSYITKQYDNVLADGNNGLVFKIDYNYNFDVDTNHSNDVKAHNVSYSLADNLPVIDYEKLIKNNLSDRKGDYRYMLGWKVTYQISAEDQLKISKVALEYRVSENSPWQAIREIPVNDNKYDERIEWTIPNNVSLLTETMQLRVKVYNPSGKFTAVVSPAFKVFENDLNISLVSVDKSSYKSSEKIMVSYSISHKTPIERFSIYLKQGDYSRTLYEYNAGDAVALFDNNSLQFTVPNKSQLIGNNAFIEIYTKDDNGAYKRETSNTFTIIQDTSVPKPFSAYQDVFTQQYNNFPSDTSHHGTDNYVKKVIIDDNGLVHLLIEQIASWWGKKSNGHTTYSNRNFKYMYMTYNPVTKASSSAVKIFENRMINNGNLPDERYKDFIVNGNVAVMISHNDETNQLIKYQVNGSSVSNNILLTGSDYDSYTLLNHRGKTYLTYRYIASAVEDKRSKALEVYPNVGVSHNIIDEYHGSSVRVNSDYISFYYSGITYKLDSTLHAIPSTKYDIGEREGALRGEIGIYDSSVKEMYLNNDETLFLVKTDNSEEVLFHLDDSKVAISGSGRQRIEAAVYPDRVIVVYEFAPDEHQYKVVIYNRQSKTKESVIVGNKIYGFGDTDSNINFNSHKHIVIANPDGKYDTAAQLISADLTNGFSAVPAVTIDTQVDSIGVDQTVNISWSLERESSSLSHFEIYKVVNGNSSLLTTVNTSNRQYSYTQINANENVVSLKVMALNHDGESSADQIVLKVIGNVSFDSFNVDKQAILLNDVLTFTWQTTGDTSSNEYKGYKKCSGAPNWDEVFSTSQKSKSLAVDDFLGECQFKIVSGTSERLLVSSVVIDGVIYQFKEGQFGPNGNYNKGGSVVNFNWETWFDDGVEFSLYIKKSNELAFSKVTTTISREHQYSGNVGTAFKWKVSFDYNGKTITSPVMDVIVKSISKPSILNAKFALSGDSPKVILTMPVLNDSSHYEIYRNQYNGEFHNIGSSSGTSYTDENVGYGSSYGYQVMIVKGNTHSIASDITIVETVLNEIYDVVMLTDNNQQLTTTSISLNYKPSKLVTYENYEVLIGENPSDLFSYSITHERAITIDGLEYGKTYYIEVYPLNYGGQRVSTLAGKLTFSTGFDNRTITEKTVISIDEVSKISIVLSWLNIKNADSYGIYRSENNGEFEFEFEFLATTENLFYRDNINIIQGSRYKYIVKAVNKSGFTVSSASKEVEITSDKALKLITLSGVESVNENSSVTYTATAYYSDGSSEDVTTRASWSENSPYASISNKGVLSTTEVLNDTTLTVSASYSYQTTSKSNSKSVKIINQGGGSEPISDSDGDGISDIEEIKYGLNPNDPSDAGADKDNDGYSNIEEIEAGSDINDPNSLPKRLSEITATKISERLNSKGYVSLVVEDNLAYLLAEDKLEIVDISNEENIQLLSTLNLEGSANKIVKSNDFIYIAHGKYGLRIVNISNSKAPKIVGTFYTGTDSWTGWVEDVAVHGDYAYIAYNGGGGLNIVNISNKENPTLEGKYSQGGFGFVKVQGGYIYVESFGGKRGLSIVKFNPLATFDQRVTLVGRYDEDSSSAYVRDVSIKGNIAYLLINHVGARVLDISNKSQPTLISTISFDDNHASLNALAQYLFVSSSNFLGVQIFDVGDKKYKLLGKLNPYSGSRQSIFINNNLYVVGSSKGFRIYKITPNLFSSNMSSNNTNGLVSPIIYMLLMPKDNLY